MFVRLVTGMINGAREAFHLGSHVDWAVIVGLLRQNDPLTAMDYPAAQFELIPR